MPQLLAFLALAMSSLAIEATAAELAGRVIAVADGDTLTLLTAEKQQVKIRLAEIDAPESGQPYGKKSKQALSDLVFGKDIRVITQTVDRYGRTVGWPQVGEIAVCEEMVRSGAAWVYREYLVHDALIDIEGEARAAERGLWGLSEAQNMPPWQWRRQGGQEGAPEGCVIKGNINSKGQRIYHAPGMPSYEATRIDQAKGERWFCSEAEAKAADWRAPKN